MTQIEDCRDDFKLAVGCSVMLMDGVGGLVLWMVVCGFWSCAIKIVKRIRKLKWKRGKKM